MNPRHPVGAVCTNDGEVSHADVTGLALFEEAHPPGAVRIAWVTPPHVIQKSAVDFVDDIEHAWTNQFKEPHRPFLKRLGE
jgi:hypothetical protein